MDGSAPMVAGGAAGTVGSWNLPCLRSVPPRSKRKPGQPMSARAPEPRKGMPSPRLDEQEFLARFLGQFPRPGLRSAARRARPDRRRRLGRLCQPAQEPAHPQGRPRLRRSRLRPGRSTGSPRAPRSQAAQAAARRCGRPAAPPADQRLVAQRAHLPGRDVEVAAGWSRSPREIFAAAPGVEVEDPGPDPAGLRVRPPHPSLQGLLLDRGGALPLALLLLPELFARPDAGLDERDLPDVGRGARDHDRHPGELVPGLLAAEADDGPAGLRRRRQSRPDPHPRQGRQAGQGRSSSTGWDYPRHLAGRLFSVVVHGDVEGAENVRRSLVRLAALHAPGARPGRSPSSTATSATGSPTPPATRRSIADLAIQEEVRNAARTLVEAVQATRAGRQVSADHSCGRVEVNGFARLCWSVLSASWLPCRCDFATPRRAVVDGHGAVKALPRQA